MHTSPWRCLNLTFVFAATSYAFPIQRALALDDEGYAYFLDQASALTRSQDLVNTYHDVVSFIGLSNAWLTSSNIMINPSPFLCKITHSRYRYLRIGICRIVISS